MFTRGQRWRCGGVAAVSLSLGCSPNALFPSLLVVHTRVQLQNNVTWVPSLTFLLPSNSNTATTQLPSENQHYVQVIVRVCCRYWILILVRNFKGGKNQPVASVNERSEPFAVNAKTYIQNEKGYYIFQDFRFVFNFILWPILNSVRKVILFKIFFLN